jgi:hypothetical protein
MLAALLTKPLRHLTFCASNLGVVLWVSAIQRFKERFLDLDGNTKLKSKAGRYGNGSSITSSTVRIADRKVQAEKVSECKGPLSPAMTDKYCTF